MKEKQPTCAQHMWELVQGSWINIPGEDGRKNARVCKAVKAKGGYFEKSKKSIMICLTLFSYYPIPYVLFKRLSSLLFYNVENTKN